MKKFKANFVIGKKQIIMAALLLVLGGAVYVNYLYANNDGDYLATNTLNNESSEAGANYGDAQLVSGDVNTSDFFQKAALEKTKTRDTAIETVKSVLDNAEADADELAEANAKILEITQQIEDESKIESLIKAKGFSECVVYLDEETVSVIVETNGLQVEEAAQIKNIVLSQKNVNAENISIQEVAPSTSTVSDTEQSAAADSDSSAAEE